LCVAAYYLGTLGATDCDADNAVYLADECTIAFAQLGLVLTNVGDGNLCYKNGAGDGRQDGGNGAGARPVCRGQIR
jgi:hypothetical protein